MGKTPGSLAVRYFSIGYAYVRTWHGTCKAIGMSIGRFAGCPDRRPKMTKFFTSNSDTLRSLIGAIAAVVLGGTFLLAAAGPAVASPSQVQTAAESNIVRGN